MPGSGGLAFGIQLGGAEDYWIATACCERFMHTPARDAELSAAVNRQRAVSHPSWGGRSFSRNWCSACFGIDKDREANACCAGDLARLATCPPRNEIPLAFPGPNLKISTEL